MNALPSDIKTFLHRCAPRSPVDGVFIFAHRAPARAMIERSFDFTSTGLLGVVGKIYKNVLAHLLDFADGQFAFSELEVGVDHQLNQFLELNLRFPA